MLLTALASCLLLLPPPTASNPVTETLHGETIVDNYRWLEELEADSEEVKSWTTAQNDYTRSVLDALPCRRELESRLAELMTIGVINPPQMAGTRYFNTERKGTENQPVLYVREGHDGQPKALLNVNELDAKGLISLDWFTPSYDGKYLAFGISRAGDEMSVLHVLNVDTGEWLADEIPGKTTFAGWTPDSKGFLYSQLDDPKNAYSRSIRFHKLGVHRRADAPLITQKEPQRIPFAMLTRDGRWILAGVTDGWSRNDLFVTEVKAWQSSGKFEQTPIAVGLQGRFEPNAVIGDTMYMVTTFEAPQGAAWAVDLKSPQRPNWKPFIAERKDAVLGGLSEAQGLLVASYEKDATSRFERFGTDGKSLGELPLPGLGSASIVTEHDRTEAFVSYMSFNEPRGVYRYDLASGQRSLWARPEVPVDPALVEVKQEWATSKDGTKFPMFIVHKKGLKLDGQNPTLLYGYGGFTASMTPFFTATWFPWFEQGGVYVVANLRGGGEYGEAWHEAGMLDKKQNVFDDLYAAADYLIKSGYTSPQRLAVMGGSNGGLLTGVAVTQRPDLFTAAISAVPLLDMLRYQNFLMAKFWVPEYGTAEEPEHFKWLRAYSPYHNIKSGTKYPAVLFTAGENDSRVHPLHARKMAAAMQAISGSDPKAEPILLWVDRDGGHGQGKPLALRIRDVADQISFVMWQTGLCGR
jgi:prolyl oligopeptidase